MYALSSHSSQHTPRQVQHLDFISQFTNDIRHVRRVDNPVADALSRIESIHVTAVDFVALATAQQEDSELANLQQSNSSLTQEISLPASSTTLICDV